MKRFPVKFPIVNTIIAILCTVGTGYLGWYYFNFPTNTTGTVYQTMEHFYKPLKLAWVSPDVDEIMADIATGDPENFNILVARTALTRWRVRGRAPKAFKSLMNQYDHGLWLGTTGDDWEKALQEVDRQWFEARAIARRLRATDVTPQQEGRSNDAMSFKFLDPVVTSQVGSEITIEFKMPRGAKATGTPEIFWQTDVTNEVRPMLRRTPVLQESRTTEGLTLITLRMDMSADPLWLMTETRPTYLFLTFPNIGLGEVTSITSGDSPGLIPPDAIAN